MLNKMKIFTIKCYTTVISGFGFIVKVHYVPGRFATVTRHVENLQPPIRTQWSMAPGETFCSEIQIAFKIHIISYWRGQRLRMFSEDHA